MQTIIIAILFAAAIFYVCRLVYRNLSAKKGCASNCGKCSFSAIEPENIPKK
ncbi:MAG TPA: FeoB-associated Cys-rich membrane protein [Mucilaginibacter sp.]|jgi:hypothetical protein